VFRLSLHGCDPIEIACVEVDSAVLSGSTSVASPDLAGDRGEDLRGFEIIEQKVPVGERMYRVAGVDDVVRYASDHPRDAEAPYWAIVWEASIGLGTWILDQPDTVRSKQILELGCGLGLSGIVAASAGGQVTQTDRVAQALHLAAENALRNGLVPPEQFLADWRTWDHAQRYDVVLGSDLVYETSAIPRLVPLFRRNVGPGGELLLSAPVHREPALQLVDALYADGWQFHTDSVSVDWQRQVTEIAVWYGRRR
jgi:predicted nicotinamide N-methyase